MQKIGSAAETVGEFAAGDEALGALGKMAKAPEALLALAERYPKTAKLLMGATKGATTAGAQGAVKESGPGGEGPVKGAKEGAIGGAIGGALAEGTGQVIKPVAKSLGLGTAAEEDITRAAQPGKRNDRFISDWALAKDRLAQELGEGGKYKDFQDAADRIMDVRQKLWDDEIKPAIDKHASEEMFPAVAMTPQPGMVQYNPVSQAIRDRITPAMQRVSRQSAKAIEKFAQKFDGPMSIGDAEQTLEHMNAELTDLGYWKKTPSERAAAEKANPAIASRAAAVSSLRDELYNRLDALGEKGMKDLKKQYGAVANVEKEIRGQINTSGRQRPISLKQIIGITAGIAHGGPLGAAAAAVPVLDKLYNDPVSLLNRAVTKAAPEGAIKATAKKSVRAAGAVAEKAAPALGGELARSQSEQEEPEK
jgi:hypothetical protein